MGSPIFPQLIENTSHSACQRPAGGFSFYTPPLGGRSRQVAPRHPEIGAGPCVAGRKVGRKIGEDQSRRRLGGTSVLSRARESDAGRRGVSRARSVRT
jgi:hypothetical protein